MLQITIVNIKGTEEIADYSYQVTVNGEAIAGGTIKHHVRASGWKVLVQKLLEAEAKKEAVRCQST